MNLNIIYLFFYVKNLILIAGSIEISDQGIMPLKENSIGLLFYVTLTNENSDVDYSYSVIPSDCCLKFTNELFECGIMKLYGLRYGTIEKNESKNVILISPTRQLHDRIGWCSLELQYYKKPIGSEDNLASDAGAVADTTTGRQSRAESKKIKIQFDTSIISGRKERPDLFKDYYRNVRATKCQFEDEDPLKKCQLTCGDRYWGSKPFKDRKARKCLPVPECQSDPLDGNIKKYYLPATNKCIQVVESITQQDLDELSKLRSVPVKITNKVEKLIWKREVADSAEDEVAGGTFDLRKDDERDAEEHRDIGVPSAGMGFEEYGPASEEECEEETGTINSWLVQGIIIGLFIPLIILLLQCCLLFYHKKKGKTNKQRGNQKSQPQLKIVKNKEKKKKKKKENTIAKRKSSIKIKETTTDESDNAPKAPAIPAQIPQLSCTCHKEAKCWKTCPGINERIKSSVNFAALHASAATSFHSADFQQPATNDDDDAASSRNAETETNSSNRSITVLSNAPLKADVEVGPDIPFTKKRLSVGVGTDAPTVISSTQPSGYASTCAECNTRDAHTHDYKLILKRGISSAGSLYGDTAGEWRSIGTTSTSSEDSSEDDAAIRSDESLLRCREILARGPQARYAKPIWALRQALCGKRQRQLKRPEDLPLLSFRSDD